MRLLMMAGLLASAVAQTAVADDAFECRFTVECFETETCGETDLGIAVTQVQPQASIYQIITDAETMSGKGHTVETGGFLFQGGNVNGAHLLTIAVGGSARYSVQYFEGPMVITYHGQCEEVV
ncbi:hypothetical protein [Marivita hallyeonensis]|nr:hypothetical protein [Marivita hallyeonensis]